MPANIHPIFVRTLRTYHATLQAAATDVNGTGSTLLYSPSTGYGSRIHGITAIAEGSLSNNLVLRLFLENSGTYQMVGEANVPNYTQVSGSAAPVFDFMDTLLFPFIDKADKCFYLAPNEKLYGSFLQAADSPVRITVWGGDY